MASTLSSLSARVSVMLMDTSNLIWDAGTVTEGIRSAIGEYGTAGEAAVTLNGLDSAAATTLPAVHDTVIVLGAAGYAATARAADRAEAFQLGSESADLKAWGEARLKEFRGMLGFIFPGYLVVLSSSTGGTDAGLVAGQIGLLAAQAAAASGQEARAVAAAAAAAAMLAAEVARKMGLRQSENSPFATWSDDKGIGYGEGYDRG
jgi:hypothetical protein